MTRPAQAARQLARVLLAGPLTPAPAALRVKTALGRRPRWLAPVLERLAADFGTGARPRLLRVAGALERHPAFVKEAAAGRLRLQAPGPAPAMCPARGAPESWRLPPLTSTGALAGWLNVTAGELEWFADLHDRNRDASGSPLRHYHHRWCPKPNGDARLIESPKLRLKLMQRRILRGILDAIPPHESAHGFRPGRSVATFVAPHVRRRIVLRLDLRDFFPSIRRARITALFLTAGYPESVALRLAGVCTASVPREVLDAYPGPARPGAAFLRRKLYEAPHLPQGAPSSPALANLIAHRLDCRLSGLAAAAGATYTRYADDLVFSGESDFARVAERFHHHVCVIALEEGFEVNARKTRLMRRGVSQRAAGLVLNEQANLPRREFDTLKAILHNCARFGPVSQNRRAHHDFRSHLLGRIAHLTSVNPRRGAKLRAVFERIPWG